MSSSKARPVRWGILGTARIAEKIAVAIPHAENAELRAIASRSAEKARDWAIDHQVPLSFGSYEALIDSPDIDAVYIPLPPSLHHEWTLKAAEKGKHVLCEKPVALNATQAAEMTAACREHGVQFMDGVMWLHHPRAQEMLQPIREGKLGKIKRLTAAFTFCWPELPQNEFRLDRQMGGGSLLDLGWYCVGAAFWLWDRLPEKVWGTARFQNDIDMNFAGCLWFGSEEMASFDCGFDTGMRKWFEVAGTEASLVCDDFTRPWNLEKPRFWLHNPRGKMSEQISASRIQEVCMIEDFGRIVQSGTLEDHWPRIAVATQQICDALDLSARSERPVSLKPE